MRLYSSIRSTRIIITLTLMLLVYIAYLFYARLQSLIEYSNLVDDTNNLKFKTEECFSILKDAETGQRGYLLTKDSIFLTPLNNANREIGQALNELRTLAGNDSDYIGLVNLFILNSNKRMLQLNEVVRNDRPDANYQRENVYILIRGKLTMDDIRKNLNDLHKQIEIKLTSRQNIKNRYASITPLFMVVLSLMSITLVYIAYLIIIRELRARILVQNDLQFNINALQRSNAELEQFAYVASHDLQEPLRKIQTFGNRLQEKYKSELPDDGKFIVERMQNAAERMRVLINDLLSYSQIVNSNEKKFEDVDLTLSLQNTLDFLSEQISSSGAKIKYEKLPVIKGNRTQLEQLIMNLLSNAMKFVKPESTPVIAVRYSVVAGQQISNVKPADINKSFHKICFADNGIGFEEEYADKIFVIFQRLQSKSEYSGTGIGLAMCKRIAENHNGYIIARSKIGYGSEFMVFLPVNQ